MDPTRASVAGIVIREDRLLIAHRLSGGAMGEKWEFPGGKVEPGESGEEALVREYREEFDVPVRVGDLLAETSFEHRGIPRSLRAFQVYLLSEDLKLLEHSEWRWAPVDEIRTLDFAPSDLKLLPALSTRMRNAASPR